MVQARILKSLHDVTYHGRSVSETRRVFSNGGRRRHRRITRKPAHDSPSDCRRRGGASYLPFHRRRRRRLPLIPSPSVRRCRRSRRPERIVTPAKNSAYGMKCGGHALIRGATPAGLWGTLGTRAKRAAGDPFVPGDDPDLTYGAELVKVRCPLSPHLPLLCQSVGERGFYLITMRYVILLSSEQTYDGQGQAERPPPPT